MPAGAPWQTAPVRVPISSAVTPHELAAHHLLHELDGTAPDAGLPGDICRRPACEEQRAHMCCTCTRVLYTFLPLRRSCVLCFLRMNSLREMRCLLDRLRGRPISRRRGSPLELPLFIARDGMPEDAREIISIDALDRRADSQNRSI